MKDPMEEIKAISQELDSVLASMNEWLGNDKGLMIEDVVEWRDRLAHAIGKQRWDAAAASSGEALKQAAIECLGKMFKGDTSIAPHVAQAAITIVLTPEAASSGEANQP